MINEKILVVTDNKELFEFFAELLVDQKDLLGGRTVKFVCSPGNDLFEDDVHGYAVSPLRIKDHIDEVIQDFDLVISAHCKQIFPDKLVQNRTCINIHPGLNPYNRGWFPQVFSILNSLPLGATIHEIDEEIDHGNIIAQKAVPLLAWDTSLTAYNRVQDAEKDLIRENLQAIFTNTYTTFPPKEEGNVNLKYDFNELREIKIEETITFQKAIDKLRALTHPPYKNAYFIDPVSGDKIWIQIILEKDTSDDRSNQTKS
ncbi:MAG TPA: dTDP-4-amino-4,6-dideoxyglucose formyltransferase [Candidatus Saccharimonadales bacterium]|jgi:methionyl-tRNA formyltransferase|nr:dTDP-4-amino-4,6-dideoxyglucose formyltransferase [Candidatus Saccharimonadales bacterium]